MDPDAEAEVVRFAESMLEGNDQSHDLGHALAVYRNAQAIADDEGLSRRDRRVVFAAALLHDVADHKYPDAEAKRASLAAFLESFFGAFPRALPPETPTGDGAPVMCSSKALSLPQAAASMLFLLFEASALSRDPPACRTPLPPLSRRGRRRGRGARHHRQRLLLQGAQRQAAPPLPAAGCCRRRRQTRGSRCRGDSPVLLARAGTHAGHHPDTSSALLRGLFFCPHGLTAQIASL